MKLLPAVRLTDDPQYAAANENLDKLRKDHARIMEAVAEAHDATRILVGSRAPLGSELVVGYDGPPAARLTEADELQKLRREQEKYASAIRVQEGVLRGLQAEAAARLNVRLVTPYAEIVANVRDAARALAAAVRDEFAFREFYENTCGLPLATLDLLGAAPGLNLFTFNPEADQQQLSKLIARADVLMASADADNAARRIRDNVNTMKLLLGEAGKETAGMTDAEIEALYRIHVAMQKEAEAAAAKQPAAQAAPATIDAGAVPAVKVDARRKAKAE